MDSWTRSARRTLRKLLGEGFKNRELRGLFPRSLRKAEQLHVEVRVVGAAAMRRLNREFLNHDYATDVLSFPTASFFRELGQMGELVVCREVCVRQAREHGHPVGRELEILLVHGLLHLQGLDHEQGPEEAARMARLEARWLALGGSLRKGLIDRAVLGGLLALAALPVVCPLEQARGAEAVTGSEAPAWSCGEMSWVRPSEMKDGVFEGELEVLCQLGLGAKDRIPALRSAIVADLQAHRTLHGAPEVGEREKVPGETYDVTHELRDSKVSIRERVFVGHQAQSLLLYGSESTEVKASGMAGYLRKVSFRAEVRPKDGAERGYEVRMRNAVAVERPWFALGPVFHAIAKGVSKDKFRIAQETILRLMQQELLR